MPPAQTPPPGAAVRREGRPGPAASRGTPVSRFASSLLSLDRPRYRSPAQAARTARARPVSSRPVPFGRPWARRRGEAGAAEQHGQGTRARGRLPAPPGHAGDVRRRRAGRVLRGAAGGRPAALRRRGAGRREGTAGVARCHQVG